MWCDEIIRLFNNTYNLDLSVQRAEFFYELFCSTFRFDIARDIEEEGEDEECVLTIVKISPDEPDDTDYDLERFIYWFHSNFYRELVNELNTLNNGNNEYDDIVYSVESLERVINSFQHMQKLDDFEDFFESLRIYIENIN